MPLTWATETTLRCGDDPRSPTCRVTDTEAELIETARAGIDYETLVEMANAASIPPLRLRRLVAFLRPSLHDASASPDDDAGPAGELSDATCAPRAASIRQRRTAYVVHYAGDSRYVALCEWLLDNAGVRLAPAHESPGMSRQTPVGLLVASAVPHPRETRRWMRSITPHVAVTIRAHGVDVSPVIVPGRTACLRCRELWNAEDDPTWMLTAAQLAAMPAADVERTVSATAFGLAIAQLLGVIDGEQPAQEGSRVHPHGVTAARRARFHPDCGCREFADWLPASA